MRIGEKIGRSAIGELAKSINKEVINPFPEDVKLAQTFQGVGTTLISNRTNRKERKKASDQNPDMQTAAIKIDLIETRISTRQISLHITLRIKRGF